jgi:hypothetical protein
VLEDSAVDSCEPDDAVSGQFHTPCFSAPTEAGLQASPHVDGLLSAQGSIDTAGALPGGLQLKCDDGADYIASRVSDYPAKAGCCMFETLAPSSKGESSRPLPEDLHCPDPAGQHGSGMPFSKQDLDAVFCKLHGTDVLASGSSGPRTKLTPAATQPESSATGAAGSNTRGLLDAAHVRGRGVVKAGSAADSPLADPCSAEGVQQARGGTFTFQPLPAYMTSAPVADWPAASVAAWLRPTGPSPAPCMAALAVPGASWFQRGSCSVPDFACMQSSLLPSPVLSSSLLVPAPASAKQMRATTSCAAPPAHPAYQHNQTLQHKGRTSNLAPGAAPLVPKQNPDASSIRFTQADAPLQRPLCSLPIRRPPTQFDQQARACAAKFSAASSVRWADVADLSPGTAPSVSPQPFAQGMRYKLAASQTTPAPATRLSVQQQQAAVKQQCAAQSLIEEARAASRATAASHVLAQGAQYAAGNASPAPGFATGTNAPPEHDLPLVDYCLGLAAACSSVALTEQCKQHARSAHLPKLCSRTPAMPSAAAPVATTWTKRISRRTLQSRGSVQRQTFSARGAVALMWPQACWQRIRRLARRGAASAHTAHAAHLSVQIAHLIFSVQSILRQWCSRASE